MGLPALRLIRSRGSLRAGSVEYWSGKTTDEIVESLAPGSAAPLLVAAVGTVMDGNTRLTLLVERAYDVTGLPRTPYEG